MATLDEIKRIEEYAEINNVPIMQKDSIEFIKNFINENKILNILEIGTAIGYSAINFALSNDDVLITSIERNTDRYKEAIKNINSIHLAPRIKLLCEDALNINLTEKYDLIIIDAAKGQNINFFNKYKENLYKNGYIIIDNIKFHGLVGNSQSIESKNLRSLVRKLEESIVYIKQSNEFITEFIDVGDGLLLCQKK